MGFVQTILENLQQFPADFEENKGTGPVDGFTDKGASSLVPVGKKSIHFKKTNAMSFVCQ